MCNRHACTVMLLQYESLLVTTACVDAHPCRFERPLQQRGTCAPPYHAHRQTLLHTATQTKHNTLSEHFPPGTMTRGARHHVVWQGCAPYWLRPTASCVRLRWVLHAQTWCSAADIAAWQAWHASRMQAHSRQSSCSLIGSHSPQQPKYPYLQRGHHRLLLHARTPHPRCAACARVCCSRQNCSRQNCSRQNCSPENLSSRRNKKAPAMH